MMNRIKKSMAFVLVLAMIVSMMTAYYPARVYADSVTNYREYWSNVNTTQVMSGPSQATTFIVPSGKNLSLKAITLYHYNNGVGATPETITLKKGTQTIGTWNAVGRYNNQWWDVFPSKVLSAGTYTITCSNNATWSCNGISNYAGFAAVYGTYSNATKKTTSKPSKKIRLSKKSAKLNIGQKLKLKLKNTKASKVKWTSSKKKVANVSKKGIVKAKKKGKATITAKYKGKKYRCKITVKKSGMTRTQAYNKAKNYIKKNGFKETDGVYRIILGKDNAGFEYSFLYYEENNWIACWAEANKKAIVLCIPKNKNRTFCEFGKIMKGAKINEISNFRSKIKYIGYSIPAARRK